jgi:hypothetical protein
MGWMKYSIPMIMNLLWMRLQILPLSSGVADLMYDLPTPRQILRLWRGEGKIYASYINSATPKVG